MARFFESPLLAGDLANSSRSVMFHAGSMGSLDGAGGLPKVTSFLVNIQKKQEFQEALLNFPQI